MANGIARPIKIKGKLQHPKFVCASLLNQQDLFIPKADFDSEEELDGIHMFIDFDSEEHEDKMKSMFNVETDDNLAIELMTGAIRVVHDDCLVCPVELNAKVKFA